MRRYFFWIPNSLTIMRIVSAPLIVGLIYQHQDHNQHSDFFWNGLLLFIMLVCITDYLDGYLARKWRVETELGKMLDPIADKVLIVMMLIAALIGDFLSVEGYVAALTIIMREIILSGVREYVGYYKIKLHVSRLAKVKTAVQMIALIVIFSEHHYMEYHPIQLGEYLLFCAAIVSVITGVQYFRKAVRAMQQIRNHEK